SWNFLPVNCPIKIKFKDKFAPAPKNNVTEIKSRQILSVSKPDVLKPCQACGQEFLEDNLEGGMCSHCRARFQGCTPIYRKPSGFTKQDSPVFPVVITKASELKLFETEICPDCGWKHTEKYIRGVMPLSYYEEQYPEKQCRLTEYWIGRKKGKGDQPLTKHLKSTPPMVVTRTLWDKMNKCRHCKDQIPYEDIESVTFSGSAPVCVDCALDLKLMEKIK
ncbi:MAG: hypothetical protein ACRDC4_00755, partial [Plesiomonas sp.]